MAKGSLGTSGAQSRDTPTVLHPKLTCPATYWLGDKERTDYFLHRLVFKITLLQGCEQGCAQETIRAWHRVKASVDHCPCYLAPQKSSPATCTSTLVRILSPPSAVAKGTFLVAQGLRIWLPTWGTRVLSLVQEDSTHREQLSPAPQLLKPEGSRDPAPWEASPDLLQLGKACPPQDPQQPKDMFRLFLQAKQGKQNTNQAISIQREAGPGSQKLNGELERGT